jgi:hypothetical protein
MRDQNKIPNKINYSSNLRLYSHFNLSSGRGSISLLWCQQRKIQYFCLFDNFTIRMLNFTRWSLAYLDGDVSEFFKSQILYSSIAVWGVNLFNAKEILQEENRD